MLNPIFSHSFIDLSDLCKFDWLIDWWLIDWLIDWWLIDDWLIDWLINQFIDCLIDFLLLIIWLINQFIFLIFIYLFLTFLLYRFLACFSCITRSCYEGWCLSTVPRCFMYFGRLWSHLFAKQRETKWSLLVVSEKEFIDLIN